MHMYNTLPDTSLCAIVRDEKMNPAGGIRDFVNCVAPYVEEMVVFDTGSADGTREILEDLQGKYDHLRLFDRPFDGFASSRNVALKKVRTKWTLVLDADERLTNRDFSTLRDYLTCNLAKAYNLEFDWIEWDQPVETNYRGHNPRLFESHKENKYIHFVLEQLYSPVFTPENTKNTDISIKHFLPQPDSGNIKDKEWYRKYLYSFTNELFAKISPRKALPPPSTTKGFEIWKALNPHRHNFKGLPELEI